MIDRYTDRDAAANLLERRWFSSIAAARAMQAECEVLREVMEPPRRPGGAPARNSPSSNACATPWAISWRHWTAVPGTNLQSPLPHREVGGVALGFRFYAPPVAGTA